MDRRSAALAALLAGVFAASGSAQADIVKCRDADGRITLTDRPCEHPTVVVRTDDSGSPVTGGDDAPAIPPELAEPRHDLATHITLSPSEFGPSPAGRGRYAHLVRPAQARMLATDVATLKAARSALGETAQPRIAGR